MPLTTDAIERAQPGINGRGQPTDKPYKLGDRKGLYLLVRPNGSKWWRLKYRFHGKEKGASLGPYPTVTLDEARSMTNELRALLASGTDPSVHLRGKREAERAEAHRLASAPTFLIDQAGALSFRFGKRHVALSAAETSTLRAFLDATRTVRSEDPHATN